MCMSPLILKNRNKLTGDSIPVPCGKCPDCLKKLVSSWSFRLMQEDKNPDTISAMFVTLTYDTLHVPITRNGFMSLNKRDFQLFMKRLRKGTVEGIRLKYFAVGEYGGKTRRPHYHLILFNSSPTAVATAWQLGQCHFGQVTGASIGYTLKYMLKGNWKPKHTNDDRAPQFRLMSKSDWSFLSNAAA